MFLLPFLLSDLRLLRATVKHIRGVLGRTLSSAEDWGYIAHNPILKSKLPRRPIRQTPKAILSLDQFRPLRGQLEEIFPPVN